MPLIITNQQEKIQIPLQLESELEALVQKCLDAEKIDPGAEVSLVFVDDEEIRDLNKTYRRKDVPTDVLSFAMQEEGEGEINILDGEEEILLGDIVISLETAQRQAQEYNHSFEREVAFLMVHGLLHLLGYDHLNESDTQKMRQKEEELLTGAGLTR
ncbi:MAG: rRNA maturation RNase YbeY [Bacillota bacterium]